MSDWQNDVFGRKTLLARLNTYSQKAGELGRRARQKVFGFRLRSTAPIDRWSLPVKLRHDHRLVQRQRTFQQGGGLGSTVARYALNKARRQQQQL
ncbi:MAG: hypothetical protein JW953_03330 [Anaerolineae bacterium]|nr:hypothetical protein [Anaerolineae bacterium]